MAAITAQRILQNQVQAYNYYWQGNYPAAIAIWERLLSSEKAEPKIAQIHSYLGVAYRQAQQFGASVRHFQEAIKIYRSLSPEKEQLAEVLGEIARTFNELGQSDRAIPVLEEAISLVPDNVELKALAYRSLGTAYWLEGNLDGAVEAAVTGRNLATISGRAIEMVPAFNDLTNILLSRSKWYEQQAREVEVEGDDTERNRLDFLAEQDRIAAIETATRAVDVSQGSTNLSTVRAMLDLSELGKTGYSKSALTILEKLPPSRTKAELLMRLALDNIPLLEEAIAISETIGAKRTQSFALEQLGQVYESSGRYRQALDATESGLWIAGQIGANDSLYRLQWLRARIRAQTGQKEKAIAAYRSAISTLQKLRSEVASASPDVQLDAKTEVEPVYRELLSLLLADASSPKILHDSIDIVRQLQFSQLQSFFGDACLELRQALTNSQSSSPKTNAAIVHTILLNDSSYVILELPDGTIRAYEIATSTEQLRQMIQRWRSQLEDTKRVPLGYRELSEKLYNLLIRPIESDLVKDRVGELVFVNDGLLRNVPPAALHDGKQFLIEKYPISISLGLNLKTPVSKGENRGASIFGLSVAVVDSELDKEFPPLPYVVPETQEVLKIVGGDRYLDKSFTATNFAAEIQKDYPIVHIATHGEFAGRLESTFLRAYDERITLRQLEEVLARRKEPIALLTLSACSTAAGNERAILGLAGIALRSGVKNVVASLWSVDDKTTADLVANFYRYLEEGMNEAQALQKATIAQLGIVGDVSRWTAFVAISN
ncbi:MAG: CHAT domain-containing protein [Hydrococcus sp. CRU_1_1]|nr:CHAT domain-containing protein [Hydrococcus sp. CRU_1_1]